ncbi:MAG: nucleoside 2-deoxyribosyltransferase [Burkholderiales bacterium]|nr:nucleoside 2-deoxyribosyltransferase [Burkholderiales bacterium]
MKTLPNQTASESAPSKANIITKPQIYLAGKIGKGDWRHALIPGLRERTWSDGPIITPTYQYVGPFFVSCDHGCLHYPNSHGAIGREDCCESTITQQQVIESNNAVLTKADLVFAYITATDCHGTLCEIGYALALRKRIVVTFAPDIDAADFWFSALQCHAVYHAVRPCCLQTIVADEIRKATTPTRGRRRAPC